jgi:hypothetical protein
VPHCVGESWLQGVTVPAQLVTPVSQVQPLCVSHVLAVSDPHCVIVPEQFEAPDQVQPDSAAHEVWFAYCVHGVTVPVQLSASEHPGSVPHVAELRPEQTDPVHVPVSESYVQPV